MKKILRGPVKYRIKCHYCDCEFEYQRSDLASHDYCGYPLYEYVTCPSCGSALQHNDSVGSSTSASIGNTDTMKL